MSIWCIAETASISLLLTTWRIWQYHKLNSFSENFVQMNCTWPCSNKWKHFSRKTWEVCLASGWTFHKSITWIQNKYSPLQYITFMMDSQNFHPSLYVSLLNQISRIQHKRIGTNSSWPENLFKNFYTCFYHSNNPGLIKSR